MPTICERMNEWREPRPIDFQWSLQVSCQLPLSSPPSGPEAPPRRGGPPPQQTQTEIGQKIGLTDPAALFRFPFLVASMKIGVNEHKLVFISFLFSPVSFSFLTFSYCWFSTRNNTASNKCVCDFVYVVLLVLSPLLSFREKDEWMEGDDWRLLKYWLFRGFGRAKH